MSGARRNRRSLDDDSDDDDDDNNIDDDDDEGIAGHQLPALQDQLDSARRFLWDEDEDEHEFLESPMPVGGPPVISAGIVDGGGSKSNFGQEIDLEDTYSYSSNAAVWARKRNTLGAGDDIQYSDGTVTRISDEYGKRVSKRHGPIGSAIMSCYHTILGCLGLCVDALCFRNSSGVCMRYCLLLVLLIGAIFGGTVLFGGKGDENAVIPSAAAPVQPVPIEPSPVQPQPVESSPTNPPMVSTPAPQAQSEPTVPPATGPNFGGQVNDETRYQDIKSILDGSPLISNRKYEDSSTAQGKALNWLANQDAFRGSDSVVQRYSLAVFFFSTLGVVHDDGSVNNSWTTVENWLSGSSLCTWYGVECQNGQLTKLILNENGILGEFPPELGSLTTLEVLELRDNRISGTLPGNIFQRTNNLRMLDLGNNQLGDVVPALSSLTSLRGLNIIKNHFTTFSDPNLSALTSLNALAIDHNKLRGPMESVTLPSNLELLFMEKNQFTGSIPDQIYAMTSLTELNLGSNQLTGTISDDLAALSNLVVLKLTDNQLEGRLPDSFGSLSNLTEIYLVKNKLTGPLPPSMASLGNLQKFMLAYNEFTGSIPIFFSSLAAMEEIYFPSNNFTGSIPDIFDSMPRLKVFKIEQNQLEGEIPRSLATCVEIYEIVLDHNDLVGEIPSEFGSLSSLKTFSTQYTLLTGSVPAELCSLVDGGTLEFLATDCREGQGVECGCCHRCA